MGHFDGLEGWECLQLMAGTTFKRSPLNKLFRKTENRGKQIYYSQEWAGIKPTGEDSQRCRQKYDAAASETKPMLCYSAAKSDKTVTHLQEKELKVGNSWRRERRNGGGGH